MKYSTVIAFVAALWSSPCEAKSLHVGLEELLCGNALRHEIQLPDFPTYITHVNGTITASMNQFADQASPVQRQSLVIMTTTPALSPNVIPAGIVTTTGSQDGAYSFEVDHHIAGWNHKQKGYFNPAPIPVSLDLTRWPKQTPDGKLIFLVWTHGYTKTADGAPTVSDLPGDCLDVEVHLTIFYGPAAPAYP